MNMKSRLERAEQHVVDDGFVFAAFELVDRGGKRQGVGYPSDIEDSGHEHEDDGARDVDALDGDTVDGDVRDDDAGENGGHEDHEEQLWRHLGSGRVFEMDELVRLQAKNPGWVLWCREPYDSEDDPLMCHVPPNEWTEEMEADYLARMEAIEEQEAEQEYFVVLTRLSTGCSVEGYDEATIARAKKKLGREG